MIKKIVLWLLFIFIALTVIALVIGWSISAPKYQGSLSDHFNGKAFKNQGGVAAKGLAQVLKWAIERKPGPWTEVTTATFGPPPDKKVALGELKVTFVNHSTFLIQVDGLNILTDPIWSERTSPFSWAGPRRMRPPGIRFEDLPPINVVIISHNHYDHLDVSTLRRIAEKHQPRIITPLGVGQYLENESIPGSQDMDWWQQLSLAGDLDIMCVPAQHFSGRGMLDRDATLWCGYVIKSPFGNIYFAGDTGYGKLFQEIGERSQPIRLALLPIGAYRPQWFMSPIHTSPEEAVKIHLDINSLRSVPIHFGTFPLADDGMQEPVNDLRLALEKHQVPASQFPVLEPGESLILGAVSEKNKLDF